MGAFIYSTRFIRQHWKLFWLIIVVLLLLQVAFTKDRFVVATNYYISIYNDLHKSFHKQPKPSTTHHNI